MDSGLGVEVSGTGSAGRISLLVMSGKCFWRSL